MAIDVYDSFNESYRNSELGVGGAQPGVGQTFTGLGGTLTSSKFYLSNPGNATGTVVSKVYGVTGTPGSSGVPTGAALATSATVDSTTIPTTPGVYGLIEFTFSGVNQISLVSGTHYVITVERAEPAVSVGADNRMVNDSGNGSYLSSGTWTSTGYDMIFYVYANVSYALVRLNGTSLVSSTATPVVTGGATLSLGVTNAAVAAHNLEVSGGAIVSPACSVVGSQSQVHTILKYTRTPYTQGQPSACSYQSGSYVSQYYNT